MDRRLHVLCLAFCTLCGCANHRAIEFHDRDVTMPAIRADIGLAGPRAPLGMSIELTGGDGTPSLTSDFDVLSLQVLARYRFVGTRDVHVRAMAGLELVDFEIDERAAGMTFHRSRSSIGPAIGLDFGWRFADPVELYGRGTAGALIEATSSLRGEIGLRTQLSPHTDLFAGYRWWQIEQEDLDLLTLTSPQELELRAEGIIFGLGLRF